MISLNTHYWRRDIQGETPRIISPELVSIYGMQDHNSGNMVPVLAALDWVVMSLNYLLREAGG